MDYILCFVIVCFAVFTAGQSADLSIDVSYTSIQGELVRYQLFHGDTRDVQISTNDISLVCSSGVFLLTNTAYNNDRLYHRVNESTFLIRTVFVNIGGFMRNLLCSNGTSNITAELDFSGVGLVRNLPGLDYVGLSPGSAVQILDGTSSGFLACLSSGDLINNNNFPNLYRPNGTKFDLFPNLPAAGNVTHTFAISSTAGLQLRPRNFMEKGEYRCHTLDAENKPINITFVVYIDATDPCSLASCPQYSQCNRTATKNLCECQFQFLEYSNSICQCPEGYSLYGTNTSISCEDINECVAVPSGCSHLGHNATCTNTDGSYTCGCQTNHTVVNGVCVHSCDALNCSQYSNRMCQWNGNQTFNCECIFGYIPTANSSACSLATVPTSTMEPTVYSSTMEPTVYSSSLMSTAYSSGMDLTTTTTSVSTTVQPTEPVSHSTLLLDKIRDKISNQTKGSLTEEETDQLLSQLNSSISDTSAVASNFATAASLVNNITKLMDNITEKQLGGLIEILSSVANISVLTDIQNDVGGVGDVVSDIISAVENIAQLLAPLYYSKQNKTVIGNQNIRLEVESLELDKGTVIFGENSTAEFSLRALLSSRFDCKNGQNCPGNITDCQTVGISIQIKNVNSFVKAKVSNVTMVFESWFCADVEEEVLNNSGITLSANTDLFSFSLASVLCKIHTSNLSEPLVLHFRLQDTSLTHPTCVSLDPGPGALTPNPSTCTRVPSSSADTVSCSCNHLTSFSILMSPDTRYEHSFEMGIYTYFGLSVSILSLIIGLLIFTFIRFKVSFAIFFVHYNLMITVLLSEIVFVVGIDRSEIPVLCLLIAVALHYILLVSFCWMFFEIFNLLILIFRPRVSQKKIIHLYWPLAYGLPLIVVAITSVFSRCNYGNYRGISYPAPMSTNCWLPRREGNYWAFIGPALLIILINSVMLAVLIIKLIHIKWAGMSYRASSLRKSTSHTLAEGFVSAIRATVLLLPIMGFTWIFGVFAINSKDTISLVFQWLFLLFNCLQGFFIFLFYCVLKTEVRDAVLLLILRKVFRREIRLAEGRSLFSTLGISRKQSGATDRNTIDRSLATSESPSKSYKDDLSLVPVSPARTHATQPGGARTHSFQVAFANLATDSTKEL